MIMEQLIINDYETVFWGIATEGVKLVVPILGMWLIFGLIKKVLR